MTKYTIQQNKPETDWDAPFWKVREKESALKFAQQCFCEFLGTALLVFTACGGAGALNSSYTFNATALPNMLTPNTSPFTWPTAFCFGGVVACIAHIIGDTSGAHINPAVSLGLFVAQRISFVRMLCYSVAQFLGGIIGAAFLWGFSDSENSLGAVARQDYVTPFFFELFGTAFLVLTVLASTDKARGHTDDFSSSLAIGLTVFVVHIFLIPYTGCGINPARALGPALVKGGTYNDAWLMLYIVGPWLGGILAGLLYIALLRAPHVKKQ